MPRVGLPWNRPKWCMLTETVLAGNRLQCLEQGRSYRRINDMGSSNYMGPNMCNYNPTNRVFISKKGSPEEF
ncbi:hypothetical protein TNCV_768311 [Trichonephila clavipes]|nr:hypothetical protein TNCV_768311 [Trichonephila clavipes]